MRLPQRPLRMQLQNLGLVDYASTYQAMQDFTAKRAADTPDQLWLCEHPPVFTQGLAGLAGHLLSPGSIPVIATYRGGRRASGRAWVTDGNHRVLAAAMRGNHAALVYIPLADLFRLRDDAIRLGLATSMVSAAKVSRVRNPARRPKKRTTR